MVRFIVPFDAHNPNTRLSPVLDRRERSAFALAMLRDVVAAIRETGHQPELLATAPVECDLPVTVDARPLSVAINAILAETETEIAVVMADLPLATPEALERLLASDEEVVIAPGIGGGTNALVVRHPAFRVDYHDGSYRDHCEIARGCNATLETVDSFRLALDIDNPADLAEVLLHSDGHATQWLQDAGFELVDCEGRMTVVRTTSSG